MAVQRVRPSFAATSIITAEDRSPRVVLRANPDHNSGRSAHVERVVFRNDLTPAEALAAVCDREGEVDIVTEVAPPDAERVQASAHARLVAVDANRLLVGIFNVREDNDAPLGDVRVREALNLAVDRERLVAQGFAGHATPLAAMTPPWCAGMFPGAQPRARDAAQARGWLQAAAWPAERPLRIAAPGPLEGLAQMVASDIAEALELEVTVTAVPDEQLVPGARALIEKRLPLPWDVLLHAWFDLSSDLPPAVVHREFFGEDGAFRAGPVDAEFDRLFAAMARATDPTETRRLAEEIDAYCFAQSKALFLCAPKALYAVNRHVDFKGYRTTFELADTVAGPEHWSRR